MATYISACSQGQRTHSARTKSVVGVWEGSKKDEVIGELPLRDKAWKISHSFAHTEIFLINIFTSSGTSEHVWNINEMKLFCSIGSSVLCFFFFVLLKQFYWAVLFVQFPGVSYFFFPTHSNHELSGGWNMKIYLTTISTIHILYMQAIIRGQSNDYKLITDDIVCGWECRDYIKGSRHQTNAHWYIFNPAINCTNWKTCYESKNHNNAHKSIV